MIVSRTGPSRTSRPRKAVGSIWNGWTRSSGITAVGTIGLGIGLKSFAADRVEVEPKPRRASAEAPGENALLGVQAVFRLVPHHRLRSVDDRRADLLAALRGETVHEDGVG